MATVAISDAGTKLCKFDSTAKKYVPLVSITTAPATGAAPATIDVTALDSEAKQYILDRPDTPAFEFEYNYTAENYKTVTAEVDGKTAKQYLLVYSDGSGVKFDGIGATWIKEVAAGAAVKAGLSFAVPKKPEYVEEATALMNSAA